jgi:hypothetical protein
MSRAFPEQRQLGELVDSIREQGRPVRILGLKARQIGMSSGSCGIIYHTTTTNQNVQSLIVSVDDDSVKALHDKNEFFWELSDPIVRPMRARTSTSEMYFANPSRRKRLMQAGLRSRIFVQTAGKVHLGRSFTIQNMLASEVAFWRSGADRAYAIMQSIPDVPTSTVIMESTGNGTGDYFHDKWLAAKKRGSIWVPFFVPWTAHPAYTREPDDHYDARDLSSYEQLLINDYGLTEGQIVWRRYKIAEDFEGDENLFAQEYPLNDDEAFLASGRPAFDRVALRMHRAYVEPGNRIELNRVTSGINARHNSSSDLVVFRPPQVDRVYTIGADVSEGLEDGDFQAACVYDVMSREQVAEFHSDCDPVAYAFELAKLGMWYNMALIAVELNNDGYVVISRLRDIYANLYQYEALDRTTQRPTQRFGWRSDEDSRRTIIHEKRNALRTREAIFRSGPLLDEMESLQRDKRGKFQAPKGKHDDRVIASGIGLWLARTEAARLMSGGRAMFDEVTVRLPLELRIQSYRNRRRRDVSYEEI